MPTRRLSYDERRVGCPSWSKGADLRSASCKTAWVRTPHRPNKTHLVSNASHDVFPSTSSKEYVFTFVWLFTYFLTFLAFHFCSNLHGFGVCGLLYTIGPYTMADVAFRPFVHTIWDVFVSLVP